MVRTTAMHVTAATDVGEITVSHPNEGEPGTAVEIRQPVDLNDPLVDLDSAFRVAKMLAQSSMVPQALRGSPQNCLVTMLLGRELGLSFIQSIRGLYVLPNGTPGLRGQLLLARIRTAGHRYEFKRTDTSCTCIIRRKDEDYKVDYEGEFTLEQAKVAGLVTEKDGKLVARSNNGQPLPWELYRQDMLQWRAVARAANIGVPEIVYGFDIAGLGEGSDMGGGSAGGPVPAPGPAPQQPAPGTMTPDQARAELDRLNAEMAAQAPAGTSDTTSGTGDPAADYTVPARASKRTGVSTQADPRGAGAAAARGARPSSPSDSRPGSDSQTADDSHTPNVSPGPGRAPTLTTLNAVLRECGYRGNGAVDVASSLVRRQIDRLEDLTPGEILIACQAIRPILSEHDSADERRAALGELVEREAIAWGADEADDGTGPSPVHER